MNHSLHIYSLFRQAKLPIQTIFFEKLRSIFMMTPRQDEICNSNCQSANCPTIVGFDARNKDSLSLYLCPICNLLLRYPYQLSCGHRFCQSCLDNKQESPLKCTLCDEETSREKVVLDKGCKHDMDRLNILCYLCEWNGAFKDYEEHLNTSHTNPTCKYCSEQFNSADSLNQHRLVCEQFPIDCILKPYGCMQQYPRINEQKHFLSAEHQTTLAKCALERLSHSTNDRNHSELMASSHTTMCTNTMNDDESIMGCSIQELHEMVKQVTGSFQALSDDTQRLRSESSSYQNTYRLFAEELSKLKLSVQETDSFWNAQKSNQEKLVENLASLQQEINDLKTTSYDGTFIWKITDFQKKIADAQSERQVSIYSPPFYSSPNGYKMRLRLYPNGDGNARRTHMSLFFVLMRGEYDAVLQFPFNFKIIFTLLDQTTDKRHITDSFRPDVKSNSFQRPRSEMNIASGIPKFCPLTIIQPDNNPYVRDDAVLIKVLVDFAGIPKTILPYTLSVNPGLPIVTQHEMVKREMERQAQENSANTTPADASVKSQA